MELQFTCMCRNEEKANKVANEIKASTKNDRVFVWILDTSKLSSVRNFVKKFLATNQKIDVLINNAGACKIAGSIVR